VPAILERLVNQLQSKGKDKSSAYAIATSSLQKNGDLKKGTQQATTQGNKRGLMSPMQRAVARGKRARTKAKK